MTKKVLKKILRIYERNFFVNLRKKLFLAAHAADFFGPAARRRPKLTGAPPPTQWRRRTALL